MASSSAALDTLQYGLAGNAEAAHRLVHREVALRRFFDKAGAQIFGQANAPGSSRVNCSPRMKPSLSQRWTVEVAVPRTAAACLTVSNSPSGRVVGGLKRGMFHCRRKLLRWLAVKR
jgi:hypothetical protein